MRQWKKRAAVACLALLSMASAARADTVTFLGSSNGRSASVTFSHTGTTLSVFLKNTSANDSLVPNDVLAGLFFGVAAGTPDPALTKTGGTATVAVGSVYQLGDYPNGHLQRDDITNIAGEWAFKNFGDANYEYGIGASGFNSPFEFGVGDLFDSKAPNYSGPKSPNGMQFGLLSAGDNLSTRNSGMIESAGEYFIKDSASFTLKVSSTFDVHDIDQVRFQYGTSLSQPTFPGTEVIVPLPAAAWGGFALFGMLGARRIVRRRNEAGVA